MDWKCFRIKIFKCKMTCYRFAFEIRSKNCLQLNFALQIWCKIACNRILLLEFNPKFPCNRFALEIQRHHSRAIDFSLKTPSENRLQSKLHPKFDPRFAFNWFCTWNFLSPARKNWTLPRICTQDQPTALLLYYSAKSVGVLTQLCGTHPHPVPEDSLFPYFIQKYEFLRLNLKFPFLINIFLGFSIF